MDQAWLDELKRLVDQQYSTDDEGVDTTSSEYWQNKAEAVKARMESQKSNVAQHSATIDLLEVKKSDLPFVIESNYSFSLYPYIFEKKKTPSPKLLGSFLKRLPPRLQYAKNMLTPPVDTTPDIEKYSLTIYEIKTKTPSGMPCNIRCKFNLQKDGRFQHAPWFDRIINSTNSLDRITNQDILDIIKWFKAVQQMPALL